MNSEEFEKTIEREFVPYELAMELKNLGFNEPGFGFYFGALKRGTDEPIKCLAIDKTRFQAQYAGQECTAPLWQQAFDWLRKERGIMYIVDDITVSASDTTGYRFRYYAWKFTDDECFAIDKSILGFLTYEEARLECLKEIIEFVKKLPKRKPYALMSLEELEVELQEVWDKGDNTDEEMDFLIRPLESLIKGIVSKLPKPKITDNDSWWTGRNRIKTFTSWQDAVAYWESNQLTQKDKDTNNSILA